MSLGSRVCFVELAIIAHFGDMQYSSVHVSFTRTK